MAIFVYREQNSTGARELAAALAGQRIRLIENGSGFRRLRSGRIRPVPIRREDVVVAWGSRLQGVAARILNGAPLQNKYEDALRLKAAGVATIEVSLTRPSQPQPVAPARLPDPAVILWEAFREQLDDISALPFSRSRPLTDGLTAFAGSLQSLRAALGRPAPVAPPAPAAAPIGDWLGRMNNHTGGSDLLHPQGAPQYWVKKEVFVKEYRVHSFAGKSIRAGIKAPREGMTTNIHPWIRSWDGGWRILYDGVSSKKRHREIAHAAVQALGLDFGAVDIGERADKSLCVLEVNRAPGLEGGTVTAYANAIRNWIATPTTAAGGR